MKKSVLLIAVLLLACVISGCANNAEPSAPDLPTPDLPADTTAAVTTTTTAGTIVTTVPTTTTTTAPVGFVSFPATGYATDSVNVRRDASVDYTAIGGLYQAEEVTVLAKTGDWYQIRFVWTDEDDKQQTTAYVNAQYISAMRPTPTSAAPTVPTVPPVTTTTTAEAAAAE